MGRNNKLEISRERTIIGRLSYRNRYWPYRIVSATFVSADITYLTAGSAAVNGHITQDDQRAVATHHPPRANADTKIIFVLQIWHLNYTESATSRIMFSLSCT